MMNISWLLKNTVRTCISYYCCFPLQSRQWFASYTLYFLALLNNHNLLYIAIDYRVLWLFFNLGNYTKCRSKTENVQRKTFQCSIPVQWIVTADEDQTGAPYNYGSATALAQPCSNLWNQWRHINISNNHNLQEINARRSIITPMIARACPVDATAYLRPRPSWTTYT